MKLNILKIGAGFSVVIMLVASTNFKNSIAKINNTNKVDRISEVISTLNTNEQEEMVVTNATVNTNESNFKNIVIESKELKEDSKSLGFNLLYPEVKLDNEHVQNKINILIKQEIYGFKKSIEDIYKESSLIHPTAFKYSGSSTFEYQIIGNILSIKVNLHQFTGGAHPMVFIRNYNFDLENGNMLKLSDIFNDEGKTIYKGKIDKIILDKMNENPTNYFIDEFKGIDDNIQFYLTKEGIVLYFQLYEIAPYTAGIPEFKIPYGEFKEYLKIKNLK